MPHLIGNEGLKVSLNSKLPDLSPQPGKGSPGPGTYEQSGFEKLLKSDGNIKFGSQTRNSMPLSARNGPAPNQYEVTESAEKIFKTGPQPVFGSSKRRSLAALNNVPGPGQYSVPSKAIEGRKFSLSGKYFHDKPKLTPGPDTYNSLDGILYAQKSPSFVFGSGPKLQLDMTSKRYVPGPGAYDTLDKNKEGISFT